VEGLETVFATQYLARFQMTRLLIPYLVANARILNVSAGGTIPIRLDFDNLNGEKFYNGIYALIHESVANDVFALRFMRDNPTICFYNYGPFFVQTRLFTDMPSWFKMLISTFGRLVATTTQVAAHDMITLLGDAHESGMYSRHLKLIKPSRYRANITTQDRLWNTSQRLVAEAPKRSKEIIQQGPEQQNSSTKRRLEGLQAAPYQTTPIYLAQFRLIQRSSLARIRQYGMIGVRMRIFVITKRHLGLGFIVTGALIISGVLAYDLLKHHAVGERLQLVALVAAVLIGILGATLVPLGDHPI